MLPVIPSKHQGLPWSFELMLCQWLPVIGSIQLNPCTLYHCFSSCLSVCFCRAPVSQSRWPFTHLFLLLCLGAFSSNSVSLTKSSPPLMLTNPLQFLLSPSPFLRSRRAETERQGEFLVLTRHHRLSLVFLTLYLPLPWAHQLQLTGLYSPKVPTS